jgi:hypothetical protein
MFKNSFFKIIPFLLFVVLFNSCDKEFNVIGEDIIGDNSFNITKEEFPVVAYNQKLGVIQSNNLEVNPLGIYDNPSFGTTTANFVTQLTLTSPGPTFDKTAVIKSVILTIPYFIDKTKTVLNSDGSSTYVLDSIYGKEKAKMKLSIYESSFYMRDLDPEEQLTKPQKYYNDQYLEFYQNIKPLDTAPYYLNDDTDKAQNEEFFFDPAEHVTVTTTDGKDVTTRNPPGMQLNLNKGFFQKKILNAPVASLATNEVFKDYFRGIFFNIESIGADRNMAMLNFRTGKISITYTETIDSKEVNKVMTLDFKGNTVSLLNETNANADYTSATDKNNVNKVKGDPNLYLKGGPGSLAILELFGEDKFGEDGISGTSNGVPDRLDIMRKNKYLINEADLVFHLNTKAMGVSPIPQRIYLYDYTNYQVLSDYYESSVVSSNTKYNKYLFGGLFKKKDANGVGDYYKFRITNHVRNLVKYKDSTNVKLGLVVTEDINKYAFYALKDKNGTPLFAPMASVMNPLGAILFGNNLLINDENYDKRLKFEIYYTKPN